MKKKLALTLIVVLLLSLFVGCSQPSPTPTTAAPTTAAPTSAEPTTSSPTTPELPEEMIWTAYDVTASGYVHAAGMADALNRSLGTNVRIIPSSTSIGRLLPLTQGKATFGFLGDETIFAVDGTYDFADITWGPQDLRTIIANPSTIGYLTTKENYDKGIQTPYDFKGLRVPYVPGSPTTNVKVDAFLAYAGLTYDDVEVVQFPSFAAHNQGLINGECDLAIAVVTGPIIYEMDTSPRGLFRLEFPASDVEGWARFNEILPSFYPRLETAGAGIHKEGGIEEVGFRFPHIITYADTSADDVYALVKALDETYEMYKDVDPLAKTWALEISSNYPCSAPFHDGVIRYLKEKGLWTEGHEKWQNDFIAKVELLQETWEIAQKQAMDEGIAGSAFPAYWMEKREEALKSLN